MGNGPLWITGAICFAVFSVSLRFAFQMMEDAKFQSSARWFFFSFVPLGVISLMWAVNGDSSFMSKNIILGAIGALIGASAFIYVGYALGDTPQEKNGSSGQKDQPTNEIQMTQNTPSSVGPIIDQSVHSTNQSGGITARTVIQGNPKYNFASPSFDGLKTQMVAALPKDKPLTVMALMGNSSSIDLALQVHKYLGDQGFKMKENGISQGVFSSMPKGISYNEHDNSVVVGEPE